MRRVGRWYRAWGLLGVVVAVSLALASASAATAAAPCADSWVGGDGNWFVASNWSSGAVPGPSDAVCITAPGSYTVTVPGGPTATPSGQALADTLQLGAATGTQKLVIQADNSCGDSSGSGALQVVNDGHAATAASIGPNGQVELTQDAATCTGSGNGASLQINSGALSNTGLITTDTGPVASSAVTDRAIVGSVTNAGGKITIAANTTWSGVFLDGSFTGDTFDNAGMITVPSAVLIVPAGRGATFINDAGGSIEADGPSSGYVFVDSGNTFRQGDGRANPQFSRPGAAPAVIVHGGTLAYTGNGRSNIEVRGQTTLAGDVPSEALLAIECSAAEPAALHMSGFTNAGFIGLYGRQPENCTSGRTLSVDTSSGPGTGTLTNAGQIEGFGTIAGSVDNVSGTITPGDTFPSCMPCTGGYTTGSIAITGSFTQEPGGSLRIITFGSWTSPEYSRLSVRGAASIGGTLNMLTGSLAHLAGGDAYLVLNAASVSSTFAKLTGQPDPSYDAQYVPAYHAADVTVNVVKIPKLTVRVAGKGLGEVTSVPAGLFCGEGSCVVGFPAGQTVILTASPGSSNPFFPPSTFAGWSGSGCHGTGACKVTISGDKSVIATFLPPRPPRCTLRLKRRRPNPTLTAIVVCNKGAGLKLTGTVTEWLGRHRRPHTRRYQLRPATDSTTAEQRTPLSIKLPRPALAALKQGHREAIRLTLWATDPSGTRRMSTPQLPLHG